jgi:hypothetical protein
VAGCCARFALSLRMENENPALLGQGGAPGTVLPVRKGRRAPLSNMRDAPEVANETPPEPVPGGLKRAGTREPLRLAGRNGELVTASPA